jgi:UDP-N-acetyl-2-amino-2-deoxyglucuronate dehydrogenase
MAEDVVRFGILGLGMGRNRAQAATQAPGAKLVCICSLEEEKAEEWAGKLDCDWTSEYEEMLDRKDIDVVGILSPSGMHCDMAVQALEAGKHTFTTKPMDIDVAKCDAAIEAAERTGRILAVDFGLRYNPVNHKIRMALHSGTFGRILFSDLIMKWYRAQSYYDGGSPPGWRSRKATEGGSIANQGVHSLDLMQWFLGPVKSAYGRSDTLNHDIETEDNTMAILEFTSGAYGLIHTSTCSIPDLGTTMEIGGDGGSLGWKNSQIEHWHSEVKPDVQLDDFEVDPNLPKNIIEDMVAAITTGKEVACDGYEGRKSVQIFNAIYESSRTGMPVQLNQG